MALSALDERFHEPWMPGGSMSTYSRRARLRAEGEPTWRIIRYADDFTILVNGTEENTHALLDEVAQVLTRLGLQLSAEKTRVVHMVLLTDLRAASLQVSGTMQRVTGSFAA